MTNIKTDTKNTKAINPESVTINEASAALFHYNILITGDGRLLDGFWLIFWSLITFSSAQYNEHLKWSHKMFEIDESMNEFK